MRTSLPPYEVLFFAEDPDAANVWETPLKALGCHSVFCDREDRCMEYLESGSWDVIIFEPKMAQFFPDDLFYKWHEVQPEAQIWFLTQKEAFSSHLKGLDEPYVQVFYEPVTPRDLFGALQSISKKAHGPVDEEARILIVDSNPTSCEALLDLLAMEGHRPRSARFGQDAVQELKRSFYHLVLLDASVTDMPLWDLVEQFLKINPDLVVVVLADYAALEGLLRTMREDVYDYLLKPLDTFAFRRTLRRALEKQKMSRQIRSLLDVLHGANQDLTRLNTVKNRFLGVVTHDLRIPLTAIKGYAQALESKLISPENHGKCLGVMVKGCEQLEHLISDLMDFVSIEAGKLRVEKKNMSAKEVFGPVVERFRPVAGNKEVDFVVKGLEDSLPQVSADPRRLDQVLTNLIGNALKHTPKGGRITVGFRKEQESVRVSVQDTGEGLSPEHLPLVFDQFYQVETSGSKREGLGLGLSITQEIIRRHQGEIGVLSDGLGKGANFWFTVPVVN